MAKTWLEKRILIRMRRLQRKKKIFDDMHNEIGEGQITKISAAEYISAACYRLAQQLNGKQKL